MSTNKITFDEIVKVGHTYLTRQLLNDKLVVSTGGLTDIEQISEELLELSKYVFTINSNNDQYNMKEGVSIGFFVRKEIATRLSNFLINDSEYYFLVCDVKNDKVISSRINYEQTTIGRHYAKIYNSEEKLSQYSQKISSRAPELYNSFSDNSMVLFLIEDGNRMRKTLYDVLIKYFQENHTKFAEKADEALVKIIINGIDKNLRFVQFKTKLLSSESMRHFRRKIVYATMTTFNENVNEITDLSNSCLSKDDLKGIDLQNIFKEIAQANVKI